MNQPTSAGRPKKEFLCYMCMHACTCWTSLGIHSMKKITSAFLHADRVKNATTGIQRLKEGSRQFSQTVLSHEEPCKHILSICLSVGQSSFDFGETLHTDKQLGKQIDRQTCRHMNAYAREYTQREEHFSFH
mmetsp:Transcript_14734/g.29736  ORF Transcript_14734/g.29736 Transcript_14734/m.29736 type:complete len:132 (-) Transcript_14734:1141-1536(-)